MADPVLFKIFLSSPGDVPQERDDAQTVIEEINASGEFGHHFILKLYRWDDKDTILPFAATDIPQKWVNVYLILPSQCDLAVFVFWSRMGTPLVMDNREYLSGTHYEYSEALEWYKKTLSKPTIWLYRCTEKVRFDADDPKLDEKIQQYKQVDQFFKQFKDAKGRYTAGMNSYGAHGAFKALFKGQLITHLRYLRDNPPVATLLSTKRAVDPNLIPYRGLNALDESDAPIFFGREAERLEVQSRVDSQRLVFVLGASGSGKSSLVAAGVLPELRKGGWQIVRCVPGDDPFYSVALALVSQCDEFGVKPIDYLSKARGLADVLSQTPENLVQQITLTLPKQRVLLFIDQFEEVFTLADKNPRLASQAITTFIQALRYPSTQVTTLLTMRADFYGTALPHFEELKQQAYGLDRPSPFALYEMITRPAKLAGLELDAGLAQQIIEEVGSASGALALIAYVMESLYLGAKKRGDNHLTRHDYVEELKGVKGAINTLADQAYAELPFDEAARQSALRAVFRELIALTEEDGQLIPTRRRAPFSTFAADSNQRQLIEKFVQARLLVKDSRSVEVAHEAILRHWEALAAWITSIKGDLALFRQYERDAKTWMDRGQDTPLPTYEALVYFYKALANLGIDRGTLPEPLKSYTEPEADRKVRELKELPPTDEMHGRRLAIGERLAVIGDTRPGVGVITPSSSDPFSLVAKGSIVPLLQGEGFRVRADDDLPDVVWLPVAPGGEITIEEHKFKVQPFYIAQYLVTYAQYQAFVEAEDGFYHPKLEWWAGMPEEYQRQELAEQRTKTANNSRDSVSWYQAVAFTRWLDHRYRQSGVFDRLSPLSSPPNRRSLFSSFAERRGRGEGWQIRLPTEWEWQWAAQNGREARDYPWGEWKPGFANTNEAGLGRAIAVGMYPQGAAACGALDIAGNLWEWCLNDSEKIEQIDISNSDVKVLRGGSFFDDQYDAACAYRNKGTYPNFRSYHYGLRWVVAPLIASLTSAESDL